MSFAVWQRLPPFTFGPGDSEQIYQVGSVWVVTDDPTKATQANVDAIMTPPVPQPTVEERLSALEQAVPAAATILKSETAT